MNNSHCPIVVLGAGVTGLTIAHYLNRQRRGFCVIDTNLQPGGVIQTLEKNGFFYETGPNTGLISHPEVVSLFDQLADKIVVEQGNDLVKRRFVLKNGKWCPLPYNAWVAITTPLFSWIDKFRILGEPWRKPGTNPHETLAELVLRRMGKSFLDYAIDPFILGVYAGDPNLLVTKYALPKLYALEQEYGSFIKGAHKKAKLPKTELEKRTNKAVFSIRGGLVQLTNALYESAGKEHFRLGASDVLVMPLENGGYQVSYKTDGQEHVITADKVVTTFGSVGLNHTLPFINGQTMKHLTNLRYARVIEVAVGFNQWKGIPLNGFGGLIPHREKRRILGVMFMSSLFKGRAPEGGALITIFMGGVRNDALCDCSDDEVRMILKEELTDLMQLKSFEPDLLEIKRYSHAIPQYEASSKERFEAIAEVESSYPGLHIAGNLRDGIGMADRIKQATHLAEIL
jgi:oxygen-dependent protoporphyrinogen oxidase